MRVLVTGGRDFADRELLFGALDRIHAEKVFAVLVHGGAKGADRLAGEWGVARGVAVEAQPADWKQYGRAAGVIRNSTMLKEKPDLVIAFPGGKGTADMVKKAKQAGIEVVVVENARPS
jgi:hypothetical protein